MNAFRRTVLRSHTAILMVMLLSIGLLAVLIAAPAYAQTGTPGATATSLPGVPQTGGADIVPVVVLLAGIGVTLVRFGLMLRKSRT